MIYLIVYLAVCFLLIWIFPFTYIWSIILWPINLALALITFPMFVRKLFRAFNEKEKFNTEMSKLMKEMDRLLDEEEKKRGNSRNNTNTGNTTETDSIDEEQK